MRSFLAALAAAGGLLLAVAAPASAHPADGGCFGTTWLGELCPGAAKLGAGNNGAATTDFGETSADDLVLVSNTPKSSTLSNTNSDLAFSGKYALAGNYNGFTIFDISTDQPAVVSETNCPGSQNDISVFGDIVVTSVDGIRSSSACSSSLPVSPPAVESAILGWEGLRIFDWSDPKAPKHIASVRTNCGSHTHTLVPDPARDRMLVYVSSYSPSQANLNCQPPHDKISIVAIPDDAPETASVIATPVLFPDGGQAGTSGCHDITAYPEIGLAAGACMGEGILMDITDPSQPKKIATMTDPNFAFWHSATFSNDGSKVIFTDELGGGTAARCTDAYGPNKGADAIYDISDRTKPELLSYFKIPRFQNTNENCVSHNGSLLPHPSRDLFVQAWYQGGTSIVDFTDARNPKEVAFFDRGPVNPESTAITSGGHWSSYWYNGRIYGNEIARGFDVLKYKHDTSAIRFDELNVQTQQRFAPGR
jgi:hypothetical protein